MTSEPPKVKESGRYPIGEAAKHLGISPRHLLRLAVAGDIKFTVSRRNAKKYFSGKELLRYWQK